MSEPTGILAERLAIEDAAQAEQRRYWDAMRPLRARWKALAEKCHHEWLGPDGYEQCRCCGMRMITGKHHMGLWQGLSS